MDDFFQHIYANGALLVMWGALIIHTLLPLPRNSHPAMLWHKFAELLASKVNNHHSYRQSQLSGVLALLLMMLPLITLLVALKPLVWHSQLFDLALLILAIDWRNTDKFSVDFIQLLAHEQKSQAKQLIAPWVNRQTETLSTLGLGKAGAETLIMSYGRNLIGVLFWYGLGGGIGALSYRFLVELARAWSPSRAPFFPFGISVIKVLAVMDYVPLKLYALIISLGRRTANVWHNIRQQSRSWPLPGPAWLLIAVGSKLELSLGGPAIYDTKKSARAKLGGRIAPSAIHLVQIRHLLLWRAAVWVALQSSMMGLIYQGV